MSKIYLPIWEGVYEESHKKVAFTTLEAAEKWVAAQDSSDFHWAYEFRIDEIELNE